MGEARFDLDSTHESDIVNNMSKRLQVLLDEAELREIQRIARAQRMTAAEWVRQAIRAATRQQTPGRHGEEARRHPERRAPHLPDP